MKKSFSTFTTIGIMILIFLFSSQNGNDSSQTSSFILSLFPYLKDIGNMEFYIRKLAHFTIYFILGLSSFQMFLAYNMSSRKSLFFSVILCFVYACTDEFHQLFSLGRAAQLYDVFIDTCGALISNIFSLCFSKRK